LVNCLAGEGLPSTYYIPLIANFLHDRGPQSVPAKKLSATANGRKQKEPDFPAPFLFLYAVRRLIYWRIERWFPLRKQLIPIFSVAISIYDVRHCHLLCLIFIYRGK
jgi:hypothetical protein